jgi:hypothetical protein
MVAMTLTTTALPTAWLAAPEGILAANHNIKIAPMPIAFSSFIAVLVGAVVIILFNYKRKEIFLDDRIIHASDNENPVTVAAYFDTTHRTHRVSQVPAIQYPPATLSTSRPAPPDIEAGPKIQDLLGLTDNNASRHNQPSPLGHKSYYAPRHAHHRGYDSDEETLNEEDKNSAYLPYPHSDVSVDAREEASHWLELPRGRGSRSQVSDADFGRRASPLSLASKTRLGDVY